jgi:hypothetical protein
MSGHIHSAFIFALHPVDRAQAHRALGLLLLITKQSCSVIIIPANEL